MYNATDEISKAVNYPHIRLFTAALVSSLVPLDELAQVEQHWSVAGLGTQAIIIVIYYSCLHVDVNDCCLLDSVNGSDWSYFSATCWFFGRDLYDSRKYPIGTNLTP